MRRWTTAPVFFTAAFGMTAWSEMPTAQAQPKPVPPVVETIRTADGMKLQGLFHETKTPKAGNNAGSSPVVILLYAPGVDHSMAKGDWESLANTLNENGFNVLRFDWRGHGKSTDITTPLGNMMEPGFWNNRYSGFWNTKYIKGGGPNKKPVKNDFKVNELTSPNSNYYPTYVQDLAAVRVHLDQKNDQRMCNTSSIYLIGSEDVAPLAFLWMTAEWNRPGIHPLLGAGQMYTVVPTPGIQNSPEGGKDIAGAVWLSASKPPNGVTAINDRLMQQWVTKTLDLRLSNPMLFLYGQQDPAGKNVATFFFKDVLVAGGDKTVGVKALEQTFVREVMGTKLRGKDLLDPKLGLKVDDTIIAYLKQLEKERGNVVAKDRKFVTPYYIDTSFFNVVGP